MIVVFPSVNLVAVPLKFGVLRKTCSQLLNVKAADTPDALHFLVLQGAGPAR